MARKRKPTLMDEMMNEVTLYGGIPIRYGDMVRDMDEKAKALDPKNWFKIREAGLMGRFSRLQMHPEHLPDDVQPLTLAEFHQLEDWPSDKPLPESIWRKWITIYPPEVRERFNEPTKADDDENAAIHAWYDDHPKKDKLRKAKTKTKHRTAHKVGTSIGRIR